MKTTERDGDCGHGARVANHQKTFNESWAGLRSQGFNRSLDREAWGSTEAWGSACAYRGRAGRKCAVGWLIPDNLYSPSMEGLAATSRRAGLAAALEELNHDLDLLVALQKAHDDSHSPESMESKLRKTARLFGLSVPS